MLLKFNCFVLQRSVYGNVGRVPHLGSTICLSMVLPGSLKFFIIHKYNFS